MTALAIVLKQRGCVVTGSDAAEVFFTDRVLRRHKIKWKEGFRGSNIPARADVVVSSVAYLKDGKPMNEEVEEALKRRRRVLTYPQAIGELAKDYRVIAVSGSHGKSTTTAMIGWIFERAGLDPVVLVGTKVNKWEANARAGSFFENKKTKGWLIVEADEYREAFLNYEPFGLVITNIDFDHPDYYKTKADYYRAFKKLVNKVQPKGWVVGYGDDSEVRLLIEYAKRKKLKTLTYGEQKINSARVSVGKVKKGRQFFSVKQGVKQVEAYILFAGKHNALNAAAGLCASRLCQISDEKIIFGLKTFPGTERRFQKIKSPVKGGVLIDDYAHHPTEIKATLAGARELYPDKKIAVIFQPHMFSRTKALLNDFAKCFSDADAVGVMAVYPSAREASGPVGAKELAAQAKLFHRNVSYLVDVAAARRFAKSFLAKKYAVILMGAGDVGRLFEKS